MKKVRREDILDYQSYEEEREEIRKKVLALKGPRRIHLGEHLTFLFENTETVRYQIQEMMRAEKIVREKDILHEIETYNELLGDDGELGCTLLIEIDDPEKRRELLGRWVGLPDHLYVVVEGGERVFARFDPRQVGEKRLSSVQYLKFATGGRVPVALGCDHPELGVEAEIDAARRAALADDLAS